MKNVLVFTVDTIVSIGIKALFQSDMPNATLRIASSPKEMMELLQKSDYDMLIMDRIPSLQNTPIFKGVAILILESIQMSDAIELYKSGIFGILDKRESLDELLFAMCEILDHKVYMTERFKSYLFGQQKKADAVVIRKKLSKMNSE